jgi:hypothetical protein
VLAESRKDSAGLPKKKDARRKKKAGKRQMVGRAKKLLNPPK